MKAWNVKDYKRAIKLLNLSLQFPNSHDLSYLVNNYLAGAYFETKQYSKAVEKGRECFKLKPTKSQVQLTNSPCKNNCVQRRRRCFFLFFSFFFSFFFFFVFLRGFLRGLFHEYRLRFHLNFKVPTDWLSRLPPQFHEVNRQPW